MATPTFVPIVLPPDGGTPINPSSSYAYDRANNLQRELLTDPSGALIVTTAGTSGIGSDLVQGLGTAGAPSGGFLSVQGMSSGSPVAVALPAGVSLSVIAQTSGLTTTGVDGPLSDISVVNLGSGNFAAIPAAQRNYLAIVNPSLTLNIGVNVAGGSASVGLPGTTPLFPGGSLVWESNFIPSNAMTITGTSGTGVTIFVG